MNMEFKRKLPIPMETKELYPVTPDVAETVARRRAELARIFAGEDDRLLLIIGPCSADREDSVMEYLTRLAALAEEVRDRLFIVPRVYTNKPRSTAEAYKGMLHQPDPAAAPDLFRGIITMREMHMRAVRETGFTCADEMLYPESYKYVDDLLGYVAVGARSVENQQHRLTASAVEVPVGMKNPMGGDLGALANAIRTARAGHDFVYRGWEGRSAGNPFAHAILRGYSDVDGAMHPNYDAATVLRLRELFEREGEEPPAVIVDCNHANSGKDPFRQPGIVREVLASGAPVKGFMIESYLEDGNQPVGGGVYGRSITDACLGWEKTRALVLELAGM